jgi:leader peptidase (prepilin peptidase) / N-methyltransferase
MQYPVWQLALGGGFTGAILGSFIGALCSRWPTGKSVVAGRSLCDGCAVILPVYRLVPILSYLQQQGRCHACGCAIGRDQFWSETAAAAIGASAFVLLPVPDAVKFAVMGWILLPLIILDLRHFWLPNRLLFLLGLVGFGTGIGLTPLYDWKFQILVAVLCFLLFEAIRLGYYKLRHKEGMGKGDPKLFAAIALWIAWERLPLLLLLASGAGLVFLMLSNRKTPIAQRMLPFGSFLGIAAILIGTFGF